MIQVQKLRKAFGSNRVLRDLSFEARAGDLTLLVGANGSGKSTTMRILAGLLAPDAGTIRIENPDTHDRGSTGRPAPVSYLPQSVRFHPRLTTREVLRFYARLRGVQEERAEAMLVKFGLDDHRRVATSDLSGGLRQRLGLAVLFLPDSPVLLLDEPGLSLDPAWRERLLTFLREESDRDKTVLVTTHLLKEWEGKADRCLICQRGRVATEVDPDNIPDADSLPVDRLSIEKAQ